ncbi:hypothetical protein [Marinibacterium profundimaris]|uniref:Transporter n=1 Tax=Marinibacterium profundimaris TaxID=1679460 RepID=A0A225NSY7_9RHOB|nr:hypothetical protein [Marinibacterium profundimaris]OWU77440.1 hypothetical protein ATO3_01655 [Marinibacterium profundimaris]
MYRVLLLASAGLCLASIAQAGGVDRSGQSILAIFEEGGATGSYAELSFGSVYPDVSGSYMGFATGGVATDFVMPGFAFKTDINDRISVALIYDQPWGAAVDYDIGTGYPFEGSHAALDSSALSAILKYDFDGGVSVYGGLRAQWVSADVLFPIISDYSASAPSTTAFGYLVGAAYERPEIALRVALTYFSSTTHDFEVTENSSVTGAVVSPYEQVMPEAVNLDAQTGIAEDTLLFGSVRWVNWADFTIAPPLFDALAGIPLAAYNGNYTTYTLGLGRALTDQWAASVALTYEPQAGGYSPDLGPFDGIFGVTLGAEYTNGPLVVSGGVNMSWIGDAQTLVTRAPVVTAATYENNTSIGVGLKIGYNF